MKSRKIIKDEDDEELKHKLPPLEAGQKLTLREVKPEQHFTEPPPRYNEASLVKEFEERGIGRPSTYSAILSTIQERQYVQKVGGKFSPTEIGIRCNRFTGGEFPRHFRYRDTPPGWKSNSTKSKKAKKSGPTRSASSTRNSPKISNMPKSIWRTLSGWRSRPTKNASVAALRWLLNGASTDRSTRVALMIKKNPE